MGNAEQGIAQAQTEAAKGRLAETEGLQKQQKWNIAYLDERIFIYLGAIAFVGLLVVWATASSPWILYGSLVGVILLTVLWGLARVGRIERERRERTAQAAVMSSQKQD